MNRVGALACLAVVLAAGLTSAGPVAAKPCQPTTYRVRAGDTLSSIARRFHTTAGALARANALRLDGILQIGTALRIPAGRCASGADAPAAHHGGASALARAISAAIRVPGVSRARTGIEVVDLASGKVVYALNPDLPLEPASTEKLGVAITALKRLGPGFRTETSVLGEGTRAGTTWRGNLVLKGYGDPTLSSAGLAALARAVRARGITAVSGSVVGDESYFDSRRTCPGWKPSFAIEESPLLSALVVDRGAIDGHAATRPAVAAAILFTRALRQAGVTVAGRPHTGVASSRATEIVRRASPSLVSVLAVMDTWSDNFIAEMLLKELGARVRGQGTTAAGAAVVASTLEAEGVPLAGVRLADGSGLSELDRLTARSLAAMLQTVWHEPALHPLLRTFAVAGSTGTLRNRLLGVPGHALIRGKTGTTDESSALTGFVGSRFVFAILNNGYPVDWSAAHLLQDRVAEALLADA